MNIKSDSSESTIDDAGNYSGEEENSVEQLRARLMKLSPNILHCFLNILHIDQKGSKAQLVDILLTQPFKNVHELLDGTPREERRGAEPVEVKVKVDVEVDEPVPEGSKFEKEVKCVLINVLQDMQLQLEKSFLSENRN